MAKLDLRLIKKDFETAMGSLERVHRDLLHALDNARGINSDAEEHMNWLRGKLDDAEGLITQLKASRKELDDSIADGSLRWVD